MNRTARKGIWLSVIGVLGLLLCANMAKAQVTPYIAYQGMLTQAGSPVYGTKTITLGLHPPKKVID